MDNTQPVDYIQLVSNVGFPIVVSIILLKGLLTGVNQRLDKLDSTLNEFIQTVKDMKDPKNS